MIPTAAEQHRLIIENMDLVAHVAAKYRGRKGIPYEDLLAAGREGLVIAARTWRPVARFPSYAIVKIKFSIIDFIDAWQHLVPIPNKNRDKDKDKDEEEGYCEWQVWPHGIPYEFWPNEPQTPESLLLIFEDVRGKNAALDAAWLSLSPREREIIFAQFFELPRRDIQTVARKHKISYWNAAKITHRALIKLREVVENYQKNRVA